VNHCSGRRHSAKQLILKGKRRRCAIPDSPSSWGVTKKSKTQTLGNLPQRRFRESGNPFIKLEQAVIWVSAFAGTTLRPGLQAFRQYFHMLAGGNKV
jgi:hypothetical protein